MRFIFSKNDFKAEALKNISVTSKIDLFSNYLNEPSHIDVNWENLIAFKVNKYIAVTITTQLIYDHDVLINVDSDGDGTVDMMGPRTQFKEILGIGFSYKF